MSVVIKDLFLLVPSYDTSFIDILEVPRLDPIMASAVVAFITAFMVSVHGWGVDSASAHVQCDTDHQCPDGFFCYEESQFCTRCVECIAYKRTLSWRSCPKTPSNCGVCIAGYEEEILHNGKTRDMCVQSVGNSLSHTNASEHFYERYIWAGAITILLLPVIFYVFCRKSARIDRRRVHRSLAREEPPPYRSIELTTLTCNSSEERLSEEGHELRVGQQKDSLVQAVPFQQPDYLEPPLLAFDTAHEVNSNSEEVNPAPDDRVDSTTSNMDLHDDNTMPSDWTPAGTMSDGQLMGFAAGETKLSDSEETCEPANKRHKPTRYPDDQDPCNTQLNINLFINNNVTIHKPS